MLRLSTRISVTLLAGWLCLTCLPFVITAQVQKDTNGLFLIWTSDRKYGYIDKTGAVVIQPQFDVAYDFSEGLAEVNYDVKPLANPDAASSALINGTPVRAQTDGGKWGFIDTTGKMVIKVEPPVQAPVGPFFEGLALFTTYIKDKGHVLGFMDKTGSIAIKPQFSSAYEFHEGLAAACIGPKRCGFIDKSGQFVIAPKYARTFSFSEGLGLAGTEYDKLGFIDKSGRMLIVPQFGNRANIGFHDGLSAVTVPHGGQYGFINKDGLMVITYQFDWATPFIEGLSLVSLNGKWGFIDKEGKFAIEPQFEEASIFSEGLAAVKINGKYGYIDKTGKMLIEPRYTKAHRFIDGVALVFTEDGRGYIDKTGKYIYKPSR